MDKKSTALLITLVALLPTTVSAKCFMVTDLSGISYYAGNLSQANEISHAEPVKITIIESPRVYTTSIPPSLFFLVYFTRLAYLFIQRRRLSVKMAGYFLVINMQIR